MNAMKEKEFDIPWAKMFEKTTTDQDFEGTKSSSGANEPENTGNEAQLPGARKVDDELLQRLMQMDEMLGKRIDALEEKLKNSLNVGQNKASLDALNRVLVDIRNRANMNGVQIAKCLQNADLIKLQEKLDALDTIEALNANINANYEKLSQISENVNSLTQAFEAFDTDADAGAPEDILSKVQEVIDETDWLTSDAIEQIFADVLDEQNVATSEDVDAAIAILVAKLSEGMAALTAQLNSRLPDQTTQHLQELHHIGELLQRMEKPIRELSGKLGEGIKTNELLEQTRLLNKTINDKFPKGGKVDLGVLSQLNDVSRRIQDLTNQLDKAHTDSERLDRVESQVVFGMQNVDDRISAVLRTQQTMLTKMDDKMDAVARAQLELQKQINRLETQETSSVRKRQREQSMFSILGFFFGGLLIPWLTYGWIEWIQYITVNRFNALGLLLSTTVAWLAAMISTAVIAFKKKPISFGLWQITSVLSVGFSWFMMLLWYMLYIHQ